MGKTEIEPPLSFTSVNSQNADYLLAIINYVQYMFVKICNDLLKTIEFVYWRDYK